MTHQRFITGVLIAVFSLACVAESSWAQRRNPRYPRDYRPKPNPEYPIAERAVETAKANVAETKSKLDDANAHHKQAAQALTEANAAKLTVLRQLKAQIEAKPEVIEARAALREIKEQLLKAQQRVRAQLAGQPDYEAAKRAEREAEAESAELREADVAPEARRAAALKLLEAQNKVQKLLKAAYAEDKQVIELQALTSERSATLNKIVGELEKQMRENPTWQQAIETQRQADTERSAALRDVAAAKQAYAAANQELARAEAKLRQTPKKK